MTNRLGFSLSSGSSFSATFKGFTGVFLTWVLPTAWLESLAFSLLARLKLAMSVKVIVSEGLFFSSGQHRFSRKNEKQMLAAKCLYNFDVRQIFINCQSTVAGHLRGM